MATVIFKPTEACNGRCVYCDVVHKESRAFRTMKDEILETFFVRIDEFLSERPHEDMEIIWHGGEPLILGTAFYEKALGFQEKHCSRTRDRIRHALQSNLTLVTEPMIRVLKKMGIRSIGSSYDPFSNLRGLGVEVDSREYNRKFLDGVALLEREGLGCGIIYVVTKESLDRPLDIFHHLTNFRIDGAVNLNPVIIYDESMARLRITPEEFVEFLAAIFPTWWAHRARYPILGPFSSLVRNLMEGERKLLCGDSGTCALTHLTVGPDGNLSQCGRSCDWGLLDYGSIRDKTFAQVMADPQRQVLLDRNKVLSEGECKGCRLWDICHGGCPLDSWYEAGDYMHRSFWCRAKKDLIERVIEPVIFPGGKGRPGTRASPVAAGPVPGPDPATVVRGDRGARTGLPAAAAGELLWIDPVGGLGDAVLLSSVLKQVVDRDPGRRFHLVRRTKYAPILGGHPAIASVGHPPPGARLVRNDYWAEPDYGTGVRAFQLLARMFGLGSGVEERLWVPWTAEPDPVLTGVIPWGERNVAIAPSSVAPRKQLGMSRWEELVARLRAAGVFVAQLGQAGDPPVRGAYSLLGLTTPRQLVGLMPRFDAVVTSDNFAMHAAELGGVPTVVVWGPTHHGVYGYPGQVHLQARPECASAAVGCIGAGRAHIYGTPCPEPVHCMDQLEADELERSVRWLLQGAAGLRGGAPGGPSQPIAG